ncbi:MAG: TraA family conjugative transfer protein [Sutterella sp.]
MDFKSLAKFAAPAALALSAASAMAGTGGSEFSELNDLFEGWSEGILGRILAVGALIIGISFGLVRQSVVAAVVGIAMAVVLSYGPTVIGNILTATADGSAQVAQLANGMF